MMDFDERLRSELRREAARLVPESTRPSGLPTVPGRAGGGAGWWARWRLPLLAVAAVAGVAAAVTVVALNQRDPAANVAGSGTPDAGDDAAVVVESAPPRFTWPNISRTKTYASLDELAGDSTNVVVANPTGERHDEPLPEWAARPNADTAPNTYAALTIEAVLAGGDVAAGDTIDVLAHGDDTAGRAMFSVPGRYLLFLAPYSLDADPDVPFFGVEHYVTVGGSAGIFYQPGDAAGTVFDRTDLHSTGLPETVDIDGQDLLAGWYDAAYMDHVLAGQVPESLPPLQHRPGSVDSELLRNPTQPFDCDGTETTAAASTSEGSRISFGITDETFCMSVSDAEIAGSGEETERTVHHVPLAGEGPIRALLRAGAGWESRVAGVVDGSVTTVLAIRGDEDATHPDDSIPDWEIGLIELGDFRVFVPDDSTLAVVAYADGVEVGRAALPVVRVDDVGGGFPGGDAPQPYELRDDLTGAYAQVWTSWKPVGEDAVRLFFAGGNAACYGAVVTVADEADRVGIGLRTGVKPEVDQCDAALHAAFVDVDLPSPLGDRDVVPTGGD